MTTDFQNSIKEWVLLDNDIRKASDTLKELREQKKHIETEILDFVETNDLSSKTIRISDSNLTFRKNKVMSGLTYKYIRDCLEKCISNEDHINIIMDTIKNNRDTKYVDDIRRIIDN
jgi:predicted DNA binding CopG/RHH family protein